MQICCIKYDSFDEKYAKIQFAYKCLIILYDYQNEHIFYISLLYSIIHMNKPYLVYFRNTRIILNIFLIHLTLLEEANAHVLFPWNCEVDRESFLPPMTISFIQTFRMRKILRRWALLRYLLLSTVTILAISTCYSYFCRYRY